MTRSVWAYPQVATALGLKVDVRGFVVCARNTVADVIVSAVVFAVAFVFVLSGKKCIVRFVLEPFAQA